jgi:branched-chain amino acid transport system substrate-binding protein
MHRNQSARPCGRTPRIILKGLSPKEKPETSRAPQRSKRAMIEDMSEARTGPGQRPWKVGIMFSETGVTASIERTMAHATILALEEINAAGGVRSRPIEAVVLDPQSDPKRSRLIAKELINEYDAKVIFGCYMSSTRKAITPIIEKYNGIIFYPTPYEGYEYISNCIYTGAAPNQNSLPLGKYLVENRGTRFYFVGSNYVFPYESNRIMAELLRVGRCKLLEERYVPLNAEARHFEPIIAEIRRLTPDVVFSTVVGTATATLYRAFRQAKFHPDKVCIASLTTSEAEVAEMGTEAAEGHISAAPYFQSLPTPRNLQFVARFRKRFGPDAPITASAEAAYFQVFLFAQALELCGSPSIGPILEALAGVQYDAPQGNVRIDPENNHTYLWPRVGRINANGQFDVLRGSRVPVKPDPYMVSFGQDAWQGTLSTMSA